MLSSALCYWNLRLQPVHVIAACGIFHISWSWRVGLFPWHFAVCSLHFAQRLIQFLSPLWGLYPSHSWDGAVVELLWLTSMLGISRTNWICGFQGTDPEPKRWEVILAFWFGPLLFLLLGRKLRHSPAVLVDSSDSEIRKQGKVKNWREFYVPGVPHAASIKKTWYFKTLEVLIYLKV